MVAIQRDQICRFLRRFGAQTALELLHYLSVETTPSNPLAITTKEEKVAWTFVHKGKMVLLSSFSVIFSSDRYYRAGYL